MKVFVTGGAGFVGQAVIDALLARQHSVHALVNHRAIKQTGPAIQSFTGGLFDTKVLDAAMTGCDAVIHLVGIIKEKPSAGVTFERIHHQGTISIVDAASRAGIKRYVHMSAIGAGPNAAAEYSRTKYLAEEYVRASPLDWTIIEPSLIHGPGGDFTEMETGWARGTAVPYLFMPYFGKGILGKAKPSEIQPVYVQDVARAFVEALDNPKTVGELYPLGGPDQLTWPQMHEIAAKIIAGRTRPVFAIPAWYAKAITRIVPASLLPFTPDQVLMSVQDNICDMTKFTNDFGWTPRSFEQTLSDYSRATDASGE